MSVFPFRVSFKSTAVNGFGGRSCLSLQATNPQRNLQNSRSSVFIKQCDFDVKNHSLDPFCAPNDSFPNLVVFIISQQDVYNQGKSSNVMLAVLQFHPYCLSSPSSFQKE